MPSYPYFPPLPEHLTEGGYSPLGSINEEIIVVEHFIDRATLRQHQNNNLHTKFHEAMTLINKEQLINKPLQNQNNITQYGKGQAQSSWGPPPAARSDPGQC